MTILKRRTANRLLAALFAAAILILPLCAAGQALPPVEGRKANTAYAPAFDGQTRAPGIKTQTPYEVELVAEGLSNPWGLAALPDGRILITEKSGSLRIASPDGQISGAITGFPALADEGQGGLLDLALSPDYETTRLVYFTLSERAQSGSVTALGRGRLNEAAGMVEDFEILFRALPYHTSAGHFGSRVVIDEDGLIYLSTGDRQRDETRPNAQKPDKGHGKILRLTPDGQPAPGNPFIGKPDAIPELYSLGHRNVQGMDIDPRTGDVWISEMGPRGGDELNLIRPGLDYGWPAISYGIEYSGAPIGPGQTAREGMEQPVYYWDPVIAPSGMAFYSSDAMPEWQGNLFIGALAGQHISRLVLEGGRVMYEERLLSDESQRFRDILSHPDGSLYAITDAGRLYRVGPAR